jgi:enoyl-[acyl-carrier protein] reductase III
VDGKRAVVIGGTRGIGNAIASRLAEGGADVLVNYVRNEDAAQRFTTTATDAGWRVDAIRADVSSDKGREQLLEAVAGRFQDFSVLIFAAATGIHRLSSELTARHFDFTYALNVRAFLLLVNALLPKMSAPSSIIALSSEGAVHAMPHYGLVGSTKAALESICRQLAVELASRGIRVNVLAPGAVRTDAWTSLPGAESRLAAAASHTPRGTLVTLEEVAWAAQFLASEASSGLSGHTLVVDGGARVRGVG